MLYSLHLSLLLTGTNQRAIIPALVDSTLSGEDNGNSRAHSCGAVTKLIQMALVLSFLEGCFLFFV